MHQPNRGVHPLPVEPSCPPGWRTGPVAMRPAAAERRAPATLVYTAEASPLQPRRSHFPTGAAYGWESGGMGGPLPLRIWRDCRSALGVQTPA